MKRPKIPVVGSLPALSEVQALMRERDYRDFDTAILNKLGEAEA